MIARMWKGTTKPENADAYEAKLKPELLPGLSSVDGFQGSYLLRKEGKDRVDFVTVILFDSLDDIKNFAGANYEESIVPDDRRPLLIQHDERATHYEVVSRVEPAVTGRGQRRSN